MGVAAKYNMLNYLRSRRLYVLLIIGSAIGLLLTVVVAHYRPQTLLSSSLAFYSGWWGMSITFVVILSAIFFGGDAISSEVENKTGYFLVGQPIKRSEIYVGKWLGAIAASLIAFFEFGLITVANGVYYFGLHIPYQFGESIIFALVYLVSVMGVTFLFSSFFRSNSVSILITAILFLFAFTVIQDVVAGIANIEPWFVITYGAEIVVNVLNVPYPAHEINTTRFGRIIHTYNPTIPEGVIIMLGYFVVAFVLGLVLFERRELN
ncbi:MAG: ABC transporter permease subunit [Thermoprotei archaeon]